MDPKTAPPTDTVTASQIDANLSDPVQPSVPSANAEPLPMSPVVEHPDPSETSPDPADQPEAKAKPSPTPKPSKSPKPRSDGVATAIIATVIIVLGLAVLAVFAYLKSK